MFIINLNQQVSTKRGFKMNKKLLNLKKLILRSKDNPYWKNRLNLILFFVSLTLNVGLWLFLYFQIKPSQYPIPLHFSIYFGIDVIDKWYKIYIIPGLGLIFIFANFMLGAIIYRSEKILSYFLNFIAIFLQILLILGALSSIKIQG